MRFQTDLRVWLASLLAGLATISGAPAATMVEDAASACGGLAGSSDAVQIDSATLQAPSQLAVSERAPTPAARITPANPAFCKVLGHIEPTDPKAPPIKFQVNLPVEWNGRSRAIWRRRLQRRSHHRARPAAGLSFRQAVAARARLRHLRHRFRPRDQARRAAAGLCAQRRGLREFRPSRLQEGARCRRRPDGARLRQAAGEDVLHGIVRRRPRGR